MYFVRPKINISAQIFQLNLGLAPQNFFAVFKKCIIGSAEALPILCVSDLGE